jgi:sulfotransferase family protein
METSVTAGLAASERPPFPVIVGVPRSGTTLLRLMLDSHSDLAIPPETGFLLSPRILALAGNPCQAASAITRFPDDAPAWADFGIGEASFLEKVRRLPADSRLDDVLRLFYRLYARTHGKARAGDKTPSYLQCMPDVARVLPEARFIHIVRDGRDVAVSWSKTWFAPTNDRAELVNAWAEQIVRARASASGLAYKEVGYADLVRQPAAVLQELCEFTGLVYQPQMLDYFKRAPSRLSEHLTRYRLDGTLVISQHERHLQQARAKFPPSPERVGVWRGELSEEELGRIGQVARTLLNEIEAGTASS